MANCTCKGSKVKSAKLTEAAVAAILACLERGDEPAIIAAMFGVSVSTISRIRNGLTWKHVKRGTNV